MSMRGGLFPILLMTALAAGCRMSSDDSASADNGMTVPIATNMIEQAPAPITEQVVTAPVRPSPEVTVRAQPAPLGSLDLPPSPDAAQLTTFPDEVTAFMIDRDSCDHFRGEDAMDGERRVFLVASVAQLCTGTDARLTTLRRRYAGDPSVIAALRHYQDRIEPLALN